MAQAGSRRHPAQQAIDDGRFVAGIDPFELFCAYHLGLTRDRTYKFQNVHDVARRFGVTKDEIDQALAAYRMSPDDVVHSDFDVAIAQVDLQVSPPGVDLLGLAQMHWETFLQAKQDARDWNAELAEDAAANAATYAGKRRRDE